MTSDRLVKIRCAFDRWAWPYVRRWFHFEVDTEFLRGVAFGSTWDEKHIPTGNSATGGVHAVTITNTSGIRIEGCTFGTTGSESVVDEETDA